LDSDGEKLSIEGRLRALERKILDVEKLSAAVFKMRAVQKIHQKQILKLEHEINVLKNEIQKTRNFVHYAPYVKTHYYSNNHY